MIKILELNKYILMSKKNISDKFGFVFSTDPNFNFNKEEEEEQDTLSPDKQLLRIKLDTKIKGGKTATIIDGFVGKEDDLEDLAKKIKNHCGTGGSVKDGIAIIQGDNREKIVLWLIKNGYKNTKKAG